MVRIKKIIIIKKNLNGFISPQQPGMPEIIPLQQMGCAQHQGGSHISAGDQDGGHRPPPAALKDTINNTTEPRAGRTAGSISPSQPGQEGE